jgi:predicted TIM-barrel fold metal-dependent hydrolase
LQRHIISAYAARDNLSLWLGSPLGGDDKEGAAMSNIVATTPIIDCDSHVAEPADLWTSRLPEKWAEDAPRPVWDEQFNEMRWRVGDSLLRGVGEFAQAGWKEYPPSHPKSLEEADPASWDPKARLERLDEYGLYAQVLYPNVLGFSATAFIKLPDPELALACVSAYNDFLVDFADADPRRLIPIMMLPFWDVEASVTELHRAADLGHRGVLLAAHYDKVGLPHLWEPRWEPLLKAIEERGLSVNFHVGFNELTSDMIAKLLEVPGDEQTRLAVPVIMGNVRIISDIVCTGLCHRYPGINFVSVESGASWIPYLIESLDWNWKGHGAHHLHPEMELPSFYVRRQVYGSFWFERESIARTIELIPDNVMFETDFPHGVGLAPGPASAADGSPREMAEASLRGVPDDVKRKVLWENAARLYGVEAP